ncbi:hypothetical protein LAZ40_05730 [Cereibacter sphaeroides]|uniref:NrtR DNA-binding winged helix domain-containing protein n=1 Tax=Cereibacter sphaeroides TaxID=1063 RepID=UPI001F2F0D3E|nr:hypothetical protein [Cereibacter sphaeroides]MCE6958550.1 hypothetical protein [Cereibacter sphaeroides]MCE6972787.1 hypothetical protein [Cereibacter sphaeroides]
MSLPRATLALFIIQDDRLKVLVRYEADGLVRLPSGHGDPELDRDLAFTCRRLSGALVGDMDYDMLPIHTHSRRDESGSFDVHQIFAGLGRAEDIPEEITTGAAFVDVDPLLFQYHRDGSERLRPFRLHDEDDSSLQWSWARLKEMAGRTKIPAMLIGREFTMPELIRAYEIVSGMEIDQASFRRKIASLCILQEVGERRGISRRPARTYRITGLRMEFEKFLTMRD